MMIRFSKFQNCKKLGISFPGIFLNHFGKVICFCFCHRKAAFFVDCHFQSLNVLSKFTVFWRRCLLFASRVVVFVFISASRSSIFLVYSFHAS